MKNNILKTVIFSTIIAIVTLSSCKKNNDPFIPNASGPDVWERKYITLTGAFPDASNEAGNGGTRAFAITLEEAENPNFEVNVFANGYSLRSQRTARVQGSINGNFLYNIQYTGDDGGIFNKYKVDGGKNFNDTNEEVNTEPILGASPRWVVASEGIGVGVYASAQVKALNNQEGAGATFEDVRSNAKIAILNLNDPTISRQASFEIPLTPEQTKAGYQIGRIDVPILNAAKTKIFIGCNLTKIDLTKKSKVNDAGVQTWDTTTPGRELGTATLVVDYPSLTNPKLIYVDPSISKANNHSYRTMTQYIATDGHIYQATATSGSQILRINSATNEYDNYNFDLKTTSLGSNAVIKAWRYIKNGLGVVLYTKTGVDGGYLAIVNLDTKTVTPLSTDLEGDVGFSGLTAAQNNGTAIIGTFGQFQNIGVVGNKAYVPMTPNGLDGNLYIIDLTNKTISKGAKLKNQSGSFYLGAY